MTGEVYLCLCLHLIELFSTETPMPKRLDISNDRQAEIVLKKFRLLNQFQLDMPTCWVRFSEQLQRQVVDATCQLIKRQDREKLCAIECLAAVDPDARWFKKWMISFYGRSYSVDAIGKSGLMKQLVFTFLSFFSKISKLDGDAVNNRASRSDEGVKVLETEDIEYLGFLHSMVMLTKLCQYSGGRNLFPITVKAISNSDELVYEKLEGDKILNRSGDQGKFYNFI
jgi:hypothetical protein